MKNGQPILPIPQSHSRHFCPLYVSESHNSIHQKEKKLHAVKSTRSFSEICKICGELLVRQCSQAGQHLAFEHFQGCTSAGRNVADLILEAGFPVMDPEAVQFHPTGIVGPGILASETLRSVGGILRNKDLEPFMERYAPKMRELAPRDLVARAIETEIREGRGILNPDHQIEHVWYVIPAFFSAIICYIAVLAEVKRAPFDMPEAEQELTAGYHTEYSGMKFALFMMTEYIKMIVVSVLAATLFFGGFSGPWVDQLPWLGPLYLFIKTFILLYGIIWVRATTPRIRYDRLMALGWKVMLPVALLNVFLTAALLVLFPGLAS